jgi:hypothetical protein|tara:strand:- start:482 stop:628 length:147 start_codon:yes stop_codon:yes gene_type:complete
VLLKDKEALEDAVAVFNSTMLPKPTLKEAASAIVVPSDIIATTKPPVI